MGTMSREHPYRQQFYSDHEVYLARNPMPPLNKPEKPVIPGQLPSPRQQPVTRATAPTIVDTEKIEPLPAVSAEPSPRGSPVQRVQKMNTDSSTSLEAVQRLNTESSGHSPLLAKAPAYPNVTSPTFGATGVNNSVISVDSTGLVNNTKGSPKNMSLSPSFTGSSTDLQSQYSSVRPSLPNNATVDSYRRNAKKSNDPAVLFDYAKYMLGLGLSIDDSSCVDLQSVKSRGYHSKSASRTSILGLASVQSGTTDFQNYDNPAELKRAYLKESRHYLKKLSDRGYMEAQYILGDAYTSGIFGKVENKLAFELFQSAAKHGHIESSYRTSVCYREGLGTNRDARRAIDFLKIAASRNHSVAMMELGIYCFYSKMGLPDDVNTKKQGIKWLTRATDNATELSCAAPYELANIMWNGFRDIVIADQQYAVKLYFRAAELGHIRSNYLLGSFYETGNIVESNPDLSIYYYNVAAINGDVDAMVSLCSWYLVGSDNLPRDEDEAFSWALRAAEAGSAKAQFIVCKFYYKGIGCDKDLDKSYEWLSRSAANGFEMAIKKKKELDSKKGNGKDCIIA